MIADLDAQPFPDRAAIDQHAYVDVWRKHHGSGSVSLITARGCPFTCTWCSHSVFGYSHRRRSPANVVDEVEHIVATYAPDQLWYADDVFTINHKWLFEYAAEMERRGLRLPFETISREDRLNEEIIQTLARMGCYRLWIGAESGSQRVLDAMKRRTNAERVRSMVHLLQKYGIEVGMFIMLGYDGEERVRPGGDGRAPEAGRPGHVSDHGGVSDQGHAVLRVGGRPRGVAAGVGRGLGPRLHGRRPPLAALLPVRHALDGQRSSPAPPAPRPAAQLPAHGAGHS